MSNFFDRLKPTSDLVLKIYSGRSELLLEFARILDATIAADIIKLKQQPFVGHIFSTNGQIYFLQISSAWNALEISEEIAKWFELEHGLTVERRIYFAGVIDCKVVSSFAEKRNLK